jgi:hypothetical protein
MKCSRALISLSTRSAIIFCRSVSSNPARISAHSPMDSAQISAMLRPSMVTARISGLSRLPPQVGQGTSRMYPSYFSRDHSDSVSACRRSIHCITPSKPA